MNSKSNFQSNPPKSICILRLSALGDVTHVIPVVRAIQEKWPDTRITWICGSMENKLLSAIQNVRFVEFNKKRGWKEYWRLYKELKNQYFDVLLHMQVAARANLASMCVRSRIRVGWDGPRSRDFHGLFINRRIPTASNQHQVQAFLSFARALGIDAREPVWNIPVLEEALEFARQHIDRSRKNLIISPCSSHSLRNWGVEGYAKVADYAVGELGMKVILSGGPGAVEKKIAAGIEEMMNFPATNIVGKDTLQQLVGLLSSVDVVISPDSGPLHIANAVGVPVIGLYASTWSRRSGPYNNLENCVDKYEVAAKEFMNKSANDLRWGTKIEQPGVMDLIKPEEVIDKLRSIIVGHV